MRKFLALVMVLSLGVTVLAVVGCGGGDTNTAKEYLKTADAAFKALLTDMNNLQNSLTPALGGLVSGNASAVTPAGVQAASASIDKILQGIPQVNALYQKVDSLKGVEDYKAYADAMQKVPKADEDIMNQGKALIKELTPIASDQAALTAWAQQNTNKLMQLQTAVNTASKAYDDAQQIKKNKNLTW